MFLGASRTGQITKLYLSDMKMLIIMLCMFTFAACLVTAVFQAAEATTQRPSNMPSKKLVSSNFHQIR